MSIFTDPAVRQLIHVDVAYFDEAERQKLLQYPTAQQIEALVASGYDVSTAQFLTYYLFHKKRPGKQGYRSYAELSSKIDRALGELEDWVEYTDGSLCTAPDAVPQDGAIVERIGEAGSLCTIGKLHNLHDGDWEKIPEHPGRNGIPTFDYRFNSPLASDGERMIQVEAKGTSAPDSRKLTNAARAQKRRIDSKKVRVRQLEATQQYCYPADLRYGVVCALGRKGPLRCWLVDPPSEISNDPRRHRLLARLQFMLDWTCFLLPRSQFAASFSSRMAALYAQQDPFDLASVALPRANGEPFNVPSYGSFARSQGIFSNLCRVVDGPAVGTILRLPRGGLFFLGVQREIFEMAAKQEFEKILKYRETDGSIEKRVQCIVARGRAKSMDILGFDESPRGVGPYVRFRASGLLHYTEGGCVFGILAPEHGSMR